ncbi:1-acyl-sn-glycerol-3-phosphate acyltransferase [Psychroflexus sp. YR1-1]|uniref:1-acyl-sn-glycerol-3-phosphate acyltransferase n=1 Tax=Psychroflexus aurantiacus TaxID=2709310 RepID=A0A6B3QXS7_9FLAO|nr:lysophospholipid acyltransferase family protein [Psychroflexus aurantiacus]NEV92869.1 1-acyl-sn-glycerol-3-phosphate acyltransferase [Psychroflexus aurantiacus]
MKNIVSYPLSVIFYLFFGLTLLIFHVLQWLSFNLFGYQAHKKSVDIFNFFLLRCLNIVGTRFQYNNAFKFDPDRPHIIVSNHQSMFDIPPIIWYMRQLHPKFISKKELAKGIPGISYNLRHGGSVLIDRKNSGQALSQIKKLGHYICETKRAAVIFPEGTRSKTGIPKSFAFNGLKTLFEACPEAVVVPVCINNSWKLQREGMFPLGVGAFLKLDVLQPLEVKDFEIAELIQRIEKNITENLELD